MKDRKGPSSWTPIYLFLLFWPRRPKWPRHWGPLVPLGLFRSWWPMTLGPWAFWAMCHVPAWLTAKLLCNMVVDAVSG
jgi:hypothetical protein